MSVLINATSDQKFTRNEFDDYKIIEIVMPEGASGLQDPAFNFTNDDKIVITRGEDAFDDGTFEENNVPAIKGYPVKSLVPGYGAGLDSWEPLETGDEDGEQQIWVICDSVSLPLINKPIKFSMLPLDNGQMIFCLKEGAVRFDIIQNGEIKTLNLVRGNINLPEKVMYKTLCSDELWFATTDKIHNILRNSFISGELVGSIKVRKVKHSQHTSENESLDIAFKPHPEYSARLDNGRAYHEEQERLRLEEEERQARIIREAEAKAKAEREMAEKIKAEEEAKAKKRNATTRTKGTAKAKKRSAGSDAFLDALNMGF